MGLQRTLGVRRYETAWAILHTLRRAMVRLGREPLTEDVEVEATVVGGVEPCKGKRHLGETQAGRTPATPAEVAEMALIVPMRRVASENGHSVTHKRPLIRPIVLNAAKLLGIRTAMGFQQDDGRPQ